MEPLFLCLFYHFQTGKAGHPDIHQNHIGLQLQNLFQRLFSIFSLTADLKVQLLPVDQVADAFTHINFIVSY
ncbi:MAG: hypothetical protein PUG60_04175 [Lachnospiraceae bacterium]|nr:hypothetical protein [Lachnospiraceae bacterium]MDY4969809.1 hypothetical protein [Lachnospiraceae bacterium]